MHSKQLFILRTLTPVHVGDGMRKIRDIDFYTADSRTHIVDLDRFLPVLAEHDPKALRELEYLDQEHSIADFMGRYQALVTDDMLRTFPLDCHTQDILTGIRNGMGLPLIPGSSIKGALRTALLAIWFTELTHPVKERLLQKTTESKNPKYASQSIEKHLFGRDPHHSVMRALQITDAHFQPRDMTLLETKIFNLGFGGGWSWKSLPDKNAPMRNTLEMLTKGAEAQVTMTLDTFLLGKAGDGLGFPKLLPDNPDELIALVNGHSRRMLEEELEFFEEHDPRRDLDGLLRNLDVVRRSIPRDNSALILRLGRGGGWTSMTGNYIPHEWLGRFRTAFRMGKRGVDDFPKTRSIGLENNRPEWPLGWILLQKGNPS